MERNHRKACSCPLLVLQHLEKKKKRAFAIIIVIMIVIITFIFYLACIAVSGVTAWQEGNVNGVPVVSQAKSVAQVIGGDAKGAQRTQESFAECCHSANQLIRGDTEAARKARQQFVADAAENCINCIPVVGHAKGVAHYAEGDVKKGHDAILGASRTAAIVGGAVVRGPVGAIAAGTGFDLALTAISSAAHREFRPNGGIAHAIHNGLQGRNIAGDLFDAGVGVALDGIGGRKFKTAQGNYKLTTDISMNLRADATQRQQIVHKIVAAKNTMISKNLKQSNQVLTNVADDKGKISSGLNERARAEIRSQVFHHEKAAGIAKGVMTYPSLTNAIKSDPLLKGSKQSPLLIETPHAVPKVPTKRGDGMRRFECCAEHEAALNLKENGGGNIAETISVRKVGHRKTGRYQTVARCVNCKQLNLGKVWTDQAAGLPIPDTHATPLYMAKEGGKVLATQVTQISDDNGPKNLRKR